MDEKEKTVKRIKEKILNNTEMNNREFEFAKLNANLFKDIKFIKKGRLRENGKEDEQGKPKINLLVHRLLRLSFERCRHKLAD